MNSHSGPRVGLLRALSLLCQAKAAQAEADRIQREIDEQRRVPGANRLSLPPPNEPQEPNHTTRSPGLPSCAHVRRAPVRMVCARARALGLPPPEREGRHSLPAIDDSGKYELGSKNV